MITIIIIIVIAAQEVEGPVCADTDIFENVYFTLRLNKTYFHT